MPTPLALDNIRGNIVGGFSKDFQSFLFLQFKSAAAGRSWIAEISDEEFQPHRTWLQSTDHGIAKPELGASNTLNNNFEFGHDPVGAVCPLASHRK